MGITSLRVFVRIVVFGLLLGASSTAYADALSITSFSLNNLQFTAATGTAQFTVTGATARADAGNSFGQSVSNIDNTFPLAGAVANVNFASSNASANATTVSMSGSSSAHVSGCSCSAGSAAIMFLSGTLVVTGTEGMVNVDISGLRTLMFHAQTDQFGKYAETAITFDILVNGSVVFSVQIDHLISVGPNGLADVQATSPIAGTITLQSGVENTILIRAAPSSLVINEVPEPATIVLLVSGLGFMTGVLKKRRNF
jgi:hypothetical protein